MAEAQLGLSLAAAEFIQGQLAKRGSGLGIRLGVKTSGCSGLAYTLEYVDEQQEHDLLLQSHGVNLYVDPKSIVYLRGTELDLVTEGLNKGLKFNNPNVKASCGCGESFSVA